MRIRTRGISGRFAPEYAAPNALRVSLRRQPRPVYRGHPLRLQRETARKTLNPGGYSLFTLPRYLPTVLGQVWNGIGWDSLRAPI